MSKLRILHVINLPETNVTRMVLKVLEEMPFDSRFTTPDIAHKIYSDTGRSPSDNFINSVLRDVFEQAIPGMVRLNNRPSRWIFEKVLTPQNPLIPEDPSEDEPLRVKVTRLEAKVDELLALLKDDAKVPV